MTPRPCDDGLVLGYANLAEPAIEEGIRRLALALAELPPGAGRRRTTAARSRGSGRRPSAVRRRLSKARTSCVDRAARRDLADRALHGQQPAELALVRVGEGAVARQRLLARALPVEHRAQLAPAGEAEVERGADALGGQRQAVPGGVADEEDAVLDRAAQLVGDPVALVAAAAAGRGRRPAARSAP